jgi:uncharacterized damage-inducible protein DinB
MELLDRMLGHDAWATNLILTHCRALTDEQLDQHFDIGIGSIRPTIIHQVNTLEFWASAMEHRPSTLDGAGSPSMTELIAIHERYHVNFSRAAHAATEEKRLDELFTDVHGYPQSHGATILQTMYHNTWHRAEIRHMLNRLGVENVWDGDPQEWEYVNRERAPT